MKVLKIIYIYSNYKLKCSRQEFSDTTEAIMQFNNNPNLNSQKDGLLDPTDNDSDSSENGETLLINENDEVFENYSDFGETDSDEEDSEEDSDED